MVKITSSFFENVDIFEIAENLLGKVFVYESGDGIMKGIINEVEVYNQEDESSHSFNGRKTNRNSVMFESAGHLYVYFTYGMYYCANIVVGSKDIGEAILIRSVIPFEGKELMINNRGGKGKNISDGPAKFAMAFGLDKSFNGVDLLNINSKVYLKDDGFVPLKIERTKRIGISKSVNFDWRFVAYDLDKR